MGQGVAGKAKGLATYRSNKLKCMTNPLRLTKVGLLLLLLWQVGQGELKR